MNSAEFGNRAVRIGREFHGGAGLGRNPRLRVAPQLNGSSRWPTEDPSLFQGPLVQGVLWSGTFDRGAFAVQQQAGVG